EAGIFTYDSKLNNITYNIFRNSGDNYDSLYFYSYDTNYWYNDQNGTDPSTGNSNVNDGIKLDNSRGFNISHSNFSNNYEWGVFLTRSNDTYIFNNTAMYATVGIRIARSSNNTVISNTVFKNAEGIRIQYSESVNNTITNNYAYNNSIYGFYLYSNSNYNTLTNNSAYNNSYFGFYFYSSSNNTITNNFAYGNSPYGFYFYSSSNNTLTNNSVYNSDYGFYLTSSSDYNTLTNNSAYNNFQCGFYLSSSSNSNTLTNNYAYSNYYGFYLYSNSNYNTITNNSAYNNTQYQAYIVSSNNNLIYNNIFNASAGQGVVYDSGSNYWNTSYSCSTPNIIGGQCIGGNFYSNYTGADDGSGATYPHNIAGDGIGDNPHDYDIYGGSNVDYLPLTNKPTLCFYADTPNTVYTLTRNLYGNKSDRICITVNASNITIDCNGYNITGNMGYGNLTIGIGNYDSRNNVTIKNCYITNYTFAIYANLSTNYNITNNSLIRNGKAGIFLDSTLNSVITNNTINDTFWTADDPGGDYFQFCNWSNSYFYRFEGGIILCSSNSTSISYNYIKGNGTCSDSCLSNHNGCEAGIFTYDSKLNNITYNIFRNSGDN
ncbi:MAG: NosD domain-containing protein, partial [Candidatus Micrarchaeia archaeon]